MEEGGGGVDLVRTLPREQAKARKAWQRGKVRSQHGSNKARHVTITGAGSLVNGWLHGDGRWCLSITVGDVGCRIRPWPQLPRACPLAQPPASVVATHRVCCRLPPKIDISYFCGQQTSSWRYPTMGISKTEVNLLRLLDSAPRQQNQAKLIHYVTTSRELLEKLAAENTSEGISSIAKGRLNEYSERIEELAARLASLVPGYENAVEAIRKEESYLEGEQIRSPIALSPGLRRRLTALQEIEQPTNAKERNVAEPLRLDEAAQANIEKYRNLQEDLTDEIVELARQLKDSSLMMNQSVQATEKILDSTERAVAYSLAGTDRANAQAVEVSSLTSKTTCFQWFLLFVMTCMFIMVVLLIRVT
ncbi:hypothetical protein OsJ_28624 [Oryza sativa Japonica Group]|uniref:Uncharacterized protein n=3 Tax=Oryza sativa subsp. japonica TaxID=39947 RepID=B9G2H9_ORYSJ|nr:hypothetical protein OsJ_28624 [Oryza sativa Japonica Group]